MATWKKLITESDIPTTIVSSVSPGAGLTGTSTTSGAGVTHTINVVGGDGLDVGPNIVNLDIDGSTLTKDTNGLRVNASGITNTEIDKTVISGQDNIGGGALTAADQFLVLDVSADGGAGALRDVTAGQILAYVNAQVGSYSLSSNSTIDNGYTWADAQIKLAGPTDTYVYIEAADSNFLINEITHTGEADSIAFRLQDDVTIADTLTISNASGSGDALAVDGISQFNDNVTIGSSGVGNDKNLTVWGDLIVQGEQTILNTETLTVDDQLIVINDNPVTTLDGPGGIHVRVTSTNEARLQYDEDYGNIAVPYQTGWRATKGTATDSPIQYNGTNVLVDSVVMTMDYADTDDIPLPGDDDRGLGQMVFVDRSGADGEIYVRVS